MVSKSRIYLKRFQAPYIVLVYVLKDLQLLNNPYVLTVMLEEPD